MSRVAAAREVKVVTVREEPLPTGPKGCLIDSPECFVSFWRSVVARSSWYSEDKEHLVILCLDTRKRVKSFSLVSMGTLNESLAHPREIFRTAIVDSAYSIIVAHNHPSGDPSPSDLDLSLSRRLYLAADLLQIPLEDHVVVGDGSYFSFRQVRGLWPEMLIDAKELRKTIQKQFTPPRRSRTARTSQNNGAKRRDRAR